MQAVLLVCLLVATCTFGAGTSVQSQFTDFKEKFGKAYSSRSEHDIRLDIFASTRYHVPFPWTHFLYPENLERIATLNAQNDGATYGITQFAD